MKRITAFAVSLVIFLSACHKNDLYQLSGTAFGTYYSISYVGKENDNLPQQIDSIFQTINHNFSVFDSTSIVSQINDNRHVVLTDDFIHLLNLSQTISKQTLGAFDVTAGPLIQAWGFGKDNEQKSLSDKQIDSIRAFVGYQKMHISSGKLLKDDQRIQLDFNAIAKGYAVDKVCSLLKDAGYRNFIVDIGGEVVTGGEKSANKAWRVGVQIPTENKDGLVETDYIFELRDFAIATSGNYRNYKEENGMRFSHIINPHTGRPEKSSLLSVSVLAPDCATADAFATAFMVLGITQSMQILAKNSQLAAHFIYYENGNYCYKQTENFPKSTH